MNKRMKFILQDANRRCFICNKYKIDYEFLYNTCFKYFNKLAKTTNLRVSINNHRFWIMFNNNDIKYSIHYYINVKTFFVGKMENNIYSIEEVLQKDMKKYLKEHLN